MLGPAILVGGSIRFPYVNAYGIVNVHGTDIVNGNNIASDECMHTSEIHDHIHVTAIEQCNDSVDGTCSC